MLSFVFLSDGPCHESSWHVNDDKNQWWSRRDALVRITAAALWRRAGTWNDVVSDAAFLFKVFDESSTASKASSSHNSEYTSPVLVHNGHTVTSLVPVPTEKRLLRLWKDAFGRSSKPMNAGIGGKSSAFGVLCSNDAWKESIWRSHKQGAGIRRPSLASAAEVAKMDKRELLKLLQTNCDVEFLRKHGLNGSEALVLKKKNRDAVLSAYNDWTKTTTNPTTDASIEEAQVSVSYRRLVHTCQVLLSGMLSRMSRPSDPSNAAETGNLSAVEPTGYLLFLHEDYAQELPVFASHRLPCARKVPVICSMGAVRDALDEEVSALMEAATALGMHCVGANLGRTAEFTSKIVTALVAHTVADRLHTAVAYLPLITPHSRSKGAGAEAIDTKAVKAISKLAPVRQGGWSWDGQSNKTSSIGRKRCRQEGEEESSTVPSQLQVQGQARPGIVQHHMRVVAWLPLLATEVTDDLDQREHLQGLIQLVVTTLWRSRLASEAAQTTTVGSGPGRLASSQDEMEESSSDNAAKVVPTLYLVFRDGAVAHLTQRRLAIAMANQHMAAPSEYQVLQMLVQLLRDPKVLSPAAGRVGGGESGLHPDNLPQVLAMVLPQGLGKSARKAVRVMSITDAAEVCYSGTSALPGERKGLSSVGKTGRSLAACGYAGPCTCGADVVLEDTRHDVVVLINAPSPATSEAALRSLYEYVYPDKEVPAPQKIARKMGSVVYVGPLHSSGDSMAASAVVTVLQHFAYHDRLYAAVESAIAQQI